MHTLLALMLTAAASVVIARPPGPVSTIASQEDPPLPPTRKYLKEYWLPRFLWPHYFPFEQALQESHLRMPATEWLNQEIERLSRMPIMFKPERPREMPRYPSYIKRWPSIYNVRDPVQPYYVNQQWPAWNLVSEEALQQNHETDRAMPVPAESFNEEEKRKMFALTPRDEGYFEPTDNENKPANITVEVEVAAEGQRALHEDKPSHPETEPVPPRQTRQNPNLSRHNQKSLIAENVDDLRRGFQSGNDESTGLMDSSHQISVLEKAADSPGTFYGVALLSAIGAAGVLAVLGFALGWYTLSKRAKAAADVDYPAYGVTGPTFDASGDRKLAHSAHMYHYQHQKQQIIAMERSGMEQRSGSVTDPESEDENEEGDYTVYECPGFATTGDMEVKNPLFNDEPTPATPGKCEVVKPQPKD